MQSVTVQKSHIYDGKPRRPGQSYLAEDGHITFLTLAGLVRLGDPPLVVKKPLPESRVEPVIRADEDHEQEKPKTRKRRYYRRRDLEAEENGFEHNETDDSAGD